MPCIVPQGAAARVRFSARFVARFTGITFMRPWHRESAVSLHRFAAVL
jgi:hypothetical protein